MPDGDGACTSLLKFAINETNFENTIVAFVVSMSSPWMIMDSLKKWSLILRDHIFKLNISETKRNEYLKQQCRLFQMYQDPDESNQILNTNKKNLATIGQSNLDKKAEMKYEDDQLLPLDPSILGKNLGVPIIVIVTKVSFPSTYLAYRFNEVFTFIFTIQSDSISILDKENEYRIEHFDFIQYHVRRFCLDCKCFFLCFCACQVKICFICFFSTLK